MGKPNLTLSDGQPAGEFPVGAQLSLRMCDQDKHCCADVTNGTVNIKLVFPLGHPCRKVIFRWESVLANDYELEMELTGTTGLFYVQYFDIFLGHWWRTIHCAGKNLAGNGGPVSFNGRCNLKLDY